MISNVTKHLSILYATLDYIRIRISKKMKRDKYIDQDMIKVLVDSYVEIQKTKKTLKNIVLTLKKVCLRPFIEVSVLLYQSISVSGEISGKCRGRLYRLRTL